MKCQAEGCQCPIEARPFMLEADDGNQLLGCFCPCHAVLLYITILLEDPEAELDWMGKGDE